MTRNERIDSVLIGGGMALAFFLFNELKDVKINVDPKIEINSHGIYHFENIGCADGGTVKKETVIVEFPRLFSGEPIKRVVSNPCREK